MQQANTATMTRTSAPSAARTAPVAPTETRGSRSLRGDLCAGRSRVFRRIGTALAAVCFVFAVSRIAYLEASVLGCVPSPEMAAAAVVSGRVPPSPQATNA